jgi:glycosyltransferase involved in cell wall biosynthesis
MTKIPDSIQYVYPMWHTVSFTIVAKKHIEYIRGYFKTKVYELDELTFPHYRPHSKPIVLLHPAVFILDRAFKHNLGTLRDPDQQYIKWWKSHFGKIVGIDVADSDAISEEALRLLSVTDKLIVPSSFARDAYVRSGYDRPVHVVPHGIDPWWYEKPNVWSQRDLPTVNKALVRIWLEKINSNKKILLFWLWHSADRKGWPEVKQVYTRLRKERDDVILVIKSAIANPVEYQEVMHLGAINVYGWLSESDKLALYDLADVNIMFSRGGAFEMNCLEALGRGIPCVAHRCCGWADYIPDFLEVKKGHRVKPLPGNSIHVGYGHTVDVEDAVKVLHRVLDDIDKYKDMTKRYAMKSLRPVYRWDVVAKNLLEVI